MTTAEQRLARVAAQLLRTLRMTESQFAVATAVNKEAVKSLLEEGHLDPCDASAIFSALSEKRRSSAKIDVLCSELALAYDAVCPSITLLWPDIP